MAAGLCTTINTIANLSLPGDNMNASISDPAFMDIMEQLSVCGMTGIDLESNDMSGQLLPRWGSFTSLRILDLGGCCIGKVLLFLYYANGWDSDQMYASAVSIWRHPGAGQELLWPQGFMLWTPAMQR